MVTVTIPFMYVNVWSCCVHVTYEGSSKRTRKHARCSIFKLRRNIYLKRFYKLACHEYKYFWKMSPALL